MLVLCSQLYKNQASIEEFFQLVPNPIPQIPINSLTCLETVLERLEGTAEGASSSRINELRQVNLGPTSVQHLDQIRDKSWSKVLSVFTIFRENKV